MDAAKQQTIAILPELGSGPHAMTFSPDGKYLITALYDDTGIVWDLAHLLASEGKKDR